MSEVVGQWTVGEGAGKRWNGCLRRKEAELEKLPTQRNMSRSMLGQGLGGDGWEWGKGHWQKSFRRQESESGCREKERN